GFPVNLHRFRHAAATLWSIGEPKNVRGAKDLLGHASFRTTENHYVMAQSRLAGRALAVAIGGIARPPGVARCRRRGTQTWPPFLSLANAMNSATDFAGD